MLYIVQFNHGLACGCRFLRGSIFSEIKEEITNLKETM